MLKYLSRRREREQEEQRELIARELHDGACQYATAAKMMFDAFRLRTRRHCRAIGATSIGGWSS